MDILAAPCSDYLNPTRGDYRQFIDDLMVRFLGASVHRFAELVGFQALRAFGFRGAGKASTRERTPGYDADAFDLTETHHLALFFAINEVVVVLHRDEAGPAPQVRKIERLGKLPSIHGRSADIARLAGLDHIV